MHTYELIFSGCLSIRDVQVNCIHPSDNFEKFNKRKTITLSANFACNFCNVIIIIIQESMP